MVYGVLAEERLDKSGEIFDYARSKPHFEAWSKSFEEITKGKSKGNLRRMHQPHVAGHFTEMVFDDAAKQVHVAAKVTDDEDWKKACEGDYTGFSIGGHYKDTWPDETIKAAIRYEADPAEGSLVDNPCMYGATFSMLRAQGAQELRKFKAKPADTPAPPAPAPELSKTADPAPAPVKIEKDAAAVAAQAQTVIDGLKSLIAQAALMDGDPSTWTLMDLADALSRVLGVKYMATNDAVADGATLTVSTVTMEAAAKIGDLVKAAVSEASTKGWTDLQKNIDDYIEKQITTNLLKALEPLTQVPQAMKDGLDKTVGETVTKAVQTATEQLRKNLETLEGRVTITEGNPAAIGRPAKTVEKRIGTDPAGGAAPSIDSITKFLDDAQQSGKVSPEAMRELRIYTTSALMTS